MMRTLFRTTIIPTLAIVFAAANTGLAQLGSEITYQGRLEDNGQPADGMYDLDFSLWSAVSGGSQIGPTNSFTNVPVEDGLFTVELDFGIPAFDSPRWLEIAVDGTTLTPRQPVTGAPYSIKTRGLFVDAQDNVGIGTDLPMAPLHVEEGIAGNVNPHPSSSLVLERSTTNYLTLLSTDSTERGILFGDPSSNVNGGVIFNSPSVPDGFQFRTGGNQTRMAIASDGYVGIGRSTPIDPTSRFDVESPAGNNLFGGMQVNTAGSQGLPYYAYATAGTTRCFTHYNGGTQQWQMRFGGLTPMVVNGTNSRVGLSTFNPEFLLHVNGSAGKPGGGSWSATSDERLKKNINDLDGSLKKLLQLRGVTFEYIDPKSIHELDGERVGVIAQEVEKIFPDWVDTREDGFKAVTFRGFEALTIEALRELRDEKDKEIEALEEQNLELQDRLAALESAVESLLTQTPGR